MTVPSLLAEYILTFTDVDLKLEPNRALHAKLIELQTFYEERVKISFGKNMQNELTTNFITCFSRMIRDLARDSVAARSGSPHSTSLPSPQLSSDGFPSPRTLQYSYERSIISPQLLEELKKVRNESSETNTKLRSSNRKIFDLECDVRRLTIELSTADKQNQGKIKVLKEKAKIIQDLRSRIEELENLLKEKQSIIDNSSFPDAACKEQLEKERLLVEELKFKIKTIGSQLQEKQSYIDTLKDQVTDQLRQKQDIIDNLKENIVQVEQRGEHGVRKLTVQLDEAKISLHKLREEIATKEQEKLTRESGLEPEMEVLKGKVLLLESETRDSNLIIHKLRKEISTYESDIKSTSNLNISRNIGKHAIIIKAKKATASEDVSYEDIEKLVTENINPSKNRYNIRSFKKSGKTNLVITVDDINEINKIKKDIEIHDSLKNRFEIYYPKRLNPKLIVKFLDKEDTKEEVERTLLNQNNWLAKEDFYILFPIAAGSRNHWILAINPSSYSKIKAKNYLFYKWGSREIIDFIRPRYCTRCCRYGHTRRNCKYDECCSSCGGSHVGQCQGVRNCLNCKYANDKYNANYETDHVANDKDCICRRIQVENIKNKTDYGY